MHSHQHEVPSEAVRVRDDEALGQLNITITLIFPRVYLSSLVLTINTDMISVYKRQTMARKV